MSVDAQRFMDLMTYIHMLWSAPLQIVVSMVFLYASLGWPVFIGFVMMVLMIPLNFVIAMISRKFQVLFFFYLFSPSISLPLSSSLFLLCVFLFPCVHFPLFIFIYMIFYLHIAIQHFYSCTVGVVVVTFNYSTVGTALFISTCHLTSYS